MNYVYKYVDDTGKPIYIGITNDLKRRIEQHKYDKLRNADFADIYYISVIHREDAELLEEYLINHYGTEKHYNVAKTHKGQVSFLGDGDSFPWIKYTGNVDESAEPFMAFKEREKVVCRKEYVTKIPIDEKIRRMDADRKQCVAFFNNAISDEEQICEYLSELLRTPGIQKRKDVAVGLSLHLMKLKALKDFMNAYQNAISNPGALLNAKEVFERAKRKVDDFEGCLVSA